MHHMVTAAGHMTSHDNIMQQMHRVGCTASYVCKTSDLAQLDSFTAWSSWKHMKMLDTSNPHYKCLCLPSVTVTGGHNDEPQQHCLGPLPSQLPQSSSSAAHKHDRYMQCTKVGLNIDNTCLWFEQALI